MELGIQYLVGLVIGCVVLTHAELFTSNAHLQTALYAEKDIASLLKSYVEKEQERLDRLKMLADDYERHSEESLEHIDKSLGNPVNAFLLIKRFTLDWDHQIKPILVNNSYDSMFKELEQMRADLPNYEDLKGAAAALMRLQDTYLLDSSAIAHGNLRGVKSPQLSASDCHLLGRLSYLESDYYHCSLWMQEALDKSKKDNDKVLDHPDTLDYLSYSQAVLGDTKKALDLTNELLRLDPTHERAANNKQYFEAMLKDPKRKNTPDESKPGYQLNRDEYRNSDEFLSYEALCRGETIMPIKDEHKLTCQYRHNNNPKLLFTPAKEETVHHDPWIVVYHDVISDSEMKAIKHLATPRLNRATVQNPKTGALETATYRISKSAWLKHYDHPVVATLNERMGAITGLDMDTAEELQIANYGLGGQYEPHFDFARKEETDAFKSLGTGNRIATFLNYLSDVEAGGATVFPYIGLKLYPKRGNAAFWYNLYQNGDGIYNTRHAACPVLVGTKWVANKWIHERGQEFRRPCNTNEDD